MFIRSCSRIRKCIIETVSLEKANVMHVHGMYDIKVIYAIFTAVLDRG